MLCGAHVQNWEWIEADEVDQTKLCRNCWGLVPALRPTKRRLAGGRGVDVPGEKDGHEVIGEVVDVEPLYSSSESSSMVVYDG